MYKDITAPDYAGCIFNLQGTLKGFLDGSEFAPSQTHDI